MDVQTLIAEAPVVDNEDTSKQSWAEMMDNDSDNLKDITNTTNPWPFPSTKSKESAINEKNTHEEKVETPSVTEEITHEEKMESPITTSTSLV
ncbi:43516_t:CDS:2 [Gigaspora margarita]|uniref:43516_t:CDS:1 n=1 Tax=Gigaspora margarita TaxID=4874 RepID=A0ABN7USD6_GIGMA|nr:43516_t:CDS:2 [Gigaspora margarita]